MVYVIVLSVIAGAAGLYYFLFKGLDRFKKYDIPHLKPLPVVGNMGPSIFRTMSIPKLVQRIYDAHPEAKYTGLYDFKKPLIMLRDTELIKSIALKNIDMFLDHGTFITAEEEPLFGKNLFSLCGDKWRQTRPLLSPAFTSSKMKYMFKLMSDYAVNFANFLTQLPPEQRVIETKDTFTRYTNDVIATCAFGVSVDSMRDPKNLFYVYGREATVFDRRFIFKLFLFRKFPWLARILNLKFIREEIAKFFQDLVESTIRTRDENNIVRPDMLQLMMETRNKKEGKMEMTIGDITSQAFSFFFGGFESTSTLMCFAAHEIAVNGDIRKKLQNEIDQVLEDTKGKAPYEAINSMEYLDAVLNEALRMYPVAIQTDRACTKDFELPPSLPGAKPYTVKKGDVVWIPIYALQHDPKYFEDPEKFYPERFVGEQKKHILNTGAYLPFGLGPRMCIGNRFALLETKVLLFHLLARCDLVPCEKTPIPLKLAMGDFNLRPEGGFWLKAVPRKNPHHTVAVEGEEEQDESNKDLDERNRMNLVSNHPEEGKVQLVENYPIYIAKSKLDYLKTLREKPNQFVQYLMMLIVGSEKLKEMTPTGRAETLAIPKHIYEAVYLYVEKETPHDVLEKTKFNSTKYRKLLGDMCRKLRNPRKR